MISVYARRIASRVPRRRWRRLVCSRSSGLESVTVTLRELVERRADRGVLAPGEAGVLDPQRVAVAASTLTHSRRRGTNSAASRPSTASTANASTHVAAASRWIDSETKRLTDCSYPSAPGGRLVLERDRAEPVRQVGGLARRELDRVDVDLRAR